MRRNSISRSGFTLVELLLVIAIVGILIALILPAIQAARESARRARCQNNIKNIALAVLNYDGTNKKFPVGFVPTGPNSSVESWGWGVFVLPYLEEQAIYDQLRPSPVFLQPVDGSRKGSRNLADLFVAARTNASEIIALQTAIPAFRCPSDSTPALVPCDFDGSGYCVISTKFPPRTVDSDLWERSFLGAYSSAISPRFLPSASNYVGSRGMIDQGCPGSGSSPNWKPDQWICDSNGVFFGNSQVSIKQITDGTGKTFMIGERDKFCLAATWIGARNPLDGAEMHSSLWTLGHVIVPLNYPYTGAYNTCTEGFSSPHRGGAFFAFCDGSVHFINDDISFDLALNSRECTAGKEPLSHCLPAVGTRKIGVYQRLAWRDDGLTIDEY